MADNHSNKSDRKCKHGMHLSKEYSAWRHMKARCQNPRDKWYFAYGARGIRVCDQWSKSFAQFYEDMGPRPFESATLDRVDNDGDYEPDNCRWCTPEEQSNNNRKTRKITHNGVTHGVRQWSRIVGIHHNTLFKRLNNGWSIEDALYTPPKQPPLSVGATIPLPEGNPAR